jgi:hypothetical protein
MSILYRTANLQAWEKPVPIVRDVIQDLVEGWPILHKFLSLRQVRGLVGGKWRHSCNLIVSQLYKEGAYPIYSLASKLGWTRC